MQITEEKLKEELGIDSWKNLTKDKFLKYIELIPDVNEEIRMKVLEQMPECINFTKELVDSMIIQQKESLKSNQEISSAIIMSLNSIQKSLDTFMNDGTLTFEQRLDVAKIQIALANIFVELDRENKQFINIHWSKSIVIGVACVALIASAFGIKTRIRL